MADTASRPALDGRLPGRPEVKKNFVKIGTVQYIIYHMNDGDTLVVLKVIAAEVNFPRASAL
jgi:hypothetical protein